MSFNEPTLRNKLFKLNMVSYCLREKIEWIMGIRHPFWISMIPTYRCNLKCLHCYSNNKYDSELSTEEWETKIKGLAKRKIYFGNLTGGGEPLLREDVVLLMDKYLKCYFLVTNGSIAIPKLDKSKAMVYVSCEGLKEDNDMIRGKGHFDKMLNTILTSDTPVSITHTISKKNYKNFEKFIRYISNYSHRGINVQFYTPTYPKNSNDPLLLNKNEKIEVLKIVENLKDEGYKISILYSMLKDFKTNKWTNYCVARWGVLNILPDGQEQIGCVSNFDCNECGLTCYMYLTYVYKTRKIIKSGINEMIRHPHRITPTKNLKIV